MPTTARAPMPAITTAPEIVKMPSRKLGMTRNVMPAAVAHTSAIPAAAQPARRARSGSPMPRACPTSALAAAEKPMHGKKENVSICPMIWCAATSSVLRRNTRPDRKRMPKLNVALSSPEGRLMAKSVRVVGSAHRRRPDECDGRRAACRAYDREERSSDRDNIVARSEQSQQRRSEDDEPRAEHDPCQSAEDQRLASRISRLNRATLPHPPAHHGDGADGQGAPHRKKQEEELARGADRRGRRSSEMSDEGEHDRRAESADRLLDDAGPREL